MKYLLCLVFCFAFSSNAGTIFGKVVGVSDGDTITVLDTEMSQHKVRLIGIDAPEKKQPFGQASKQSLSELVFEKYVKVEVTKLDRYGRELGTVFVGEVDANLEQITKGFAWHYKAYQRDQTYLDRATYAQAEKLAAEAQIGLWSGSDPVAPWDYRRLK